MFEYCRYRELHDRQPAVHLHYDTAQMKAHGGLHLFDTFDLAPVAEPIGVQALAPLLRLCHRWGLLPHYCDGTYPTSWLIDDYSHDLRYISFANVYFRFRAEVMESGCHYARAIRQSTYPVAVHVRNGCGLEYYRGAMRSIRQRHPESAFFVFADDMAWAKEHLSGQHVFFVENKGDFIEGTEMYLMTLCRGHIISHSTSSYWGAYLASQTNSINIYPKQWFRETTWGIPPIFPKGWTGL
jgi:hypothetical protein